VLGIKSEALGNSSTVSSFQGIAESRHDRVKLVGEVVVDVHFEFLKKKRCKGKGK
jgi:hypothetical protein